MAIPNPNGANGTTSDPREQSCWDYYVESIQSGQVNAYQSAIKAGYSKSNALNITTREWFIERLGRLRRKGMYEKAEKVLEKTLNYETEDQDGNVKTDLLRIQTDVAKTVVKTLGKDDYSERTELTGKDGQALPTPILNINGILSNNSNNKDMPDVKED
jgi:hypothetical protein